MKQIVACVLAAALLVSALPVSAHDRPPLSGPVEIKVVADNGEALRHIPFRSMRTGRTTVVKQYLEARQGENYGVTVRNRSSERIGVVIAVDGRNIISGERSGLSHSEPMYIVNPGETGRYDGWRTSAEEVHRFFFTAPDDAYAVRTFGDSSAMGLIAVAVFRERPSPPARSRQQASPAPSAESSRDAASDTAEKRAGTGFGDSTYSPVVTVAFDAERFPARKELIKYEWREMLCRKGLVNCDGEPNIRLWDDAHYAPHPPARQ